MRTKTLWSAICAALVSTLAACSGGGGGGSDSSTIVSTPQNGTVSLLLSDDSSEDWATIGVKVLSIALIPQGGGSNVTVYTAPSTPPVINLEQLDQLGEIIGNATVPVGTYTGAVITIAGNPGDVVLIAAADPEAGFDGTAGASVPSADIHIQGTSGAAGSLSAPITVNFESNLVVTANQSNQLDLEFDLSHPAFIVAHTPVGGGTKWAVNFRGPLRHHRIADITSLVLRHTYGTVDSIASDNTSITITKDMPTIPVVNPETPVVTDSTLTILADATNGTLLYDVDGKTFNTVTTFAGQSALLLNKYVRVAARYQQDGTLVATRIWASSSFNSVWLSPEGHVLHVNSTNNVLRVSNESGGSVPLTITSATNFYFRGRTAPIGTGTSFLANVERGFKIHASVVDPLATPLVADSIDIETAAFDGVISNADSTGFTYTRKFATAADDYTQNLDYISSSTANGKDSAGNPIVGFKWWNFAYPTVVTSGANAVGDFTSAVGGSVNFGGTVGAIPAVGASFATWNDPASADAWSAPWVILSPTPLPLGKVASAFANNQFGMTVTGGATPANVDVSTTSGSATLVYQIDRTNNVISVSPEDVTTSAGLSALTAGLALGAPVKVYGVPQPDGTIKAYVLAYYTGSMPAN
ncbi:MAG TPA: DUF4382 domain-containing protein [Gammaproteobacteria bacterium]|nr:DUF4382 domain-containing protein [Gammaproteobacteria bacterium]